MSLKNQTVIVTGGAVRVGRAVCLELARAGADIFCHYNSSQKEAEELAAVIKKNGGTIHLYQGDLSQQKIIKELTQTALNIYGKIDALVNNSGVFYKTPLGTVTEKNWHDFFDLNLKAAFFLSQEVSRHMLERKQGKIINIGDAGALKPFPAYLPYSISKAGIVNMTHGFAKALAPYIQVNCINPGPVMMPGNMPQEEKEYAVEQTLLKREGSAEDIARTVRFLLEEGHYITGAVIPVDGGRHIK